MSTKPHIQPADEVVRQAEINDLLRRAQLLLFQGNLPDVIRNREEASTLIERAADLGGYGAIPDELWDLLAAIDDLVAGKIDRCAHQVKVQIPAALEMINSHYQGQLSRIKIVSDRLEGLLKQAVEMNGGKTITGISWRARLQNNSLPSVVLVDGAKVPPVYKRRRFTLSFDYGISAATEKKVQKLIQEWSDPKIQVPAGISNFKGQVEELIPAAGPADVYVAAEQKLKEALPKVKKGEPQPEIDRSKIPPIPGFEITREKHLRIEVNKVNLKEVKPIPLKKEEADG